MGGKSHVTPHQNSTPVQPSQSSARTPTEQEVHPSHLRDALKTPTGQTLTPRVIKRLHTTHGNHTVQGLVSRARGDGARHAGSYFLAAANQLNLTPVGGEAAPPEPGNAQVIQRAKLPTSQRYREVFGTPPASLNEYVEKFLVSVDMYHGIIDEARNRMIQNGDYDIDLDYAYRPQLSKQFELFKKYMTELKGLAQTERDRLNSKLFTNKDEINKVQTILTTIDQVNSQIPQSLIVDEMTEVRKEVRAVVKEKSQQNVDTFIANNPDKILTQNELAPGSVQGNVNAGLTNVVGQATFNPRAGGGGPINAPITGYTKTGYNKEGE